MPSILDTDTPCRHKEAMQAQPGFPNRRFLPGRGRSWSRCSVGTTPAAIILPLLSLLLQISLAQESPRSYQNRLTPIKHPQPLLADHPEWVEPIRETNRWESPAVVNDSDADLHVRAWRWSYNARG